MTTLDGDDPRFVALDDFHTVPGKPGEPRVRIDDVKDEPPFALELDAFLAVEDDDVAPLCGVEGKTIIPAGGLVIVGGKPSIGKTTFVIDGVFHLASGREWLGHPCQRALNILILENEGPARMFRKKLARKREAWPHEIPGRIAIQTWRWGKFSLVDKEAKERLAAFLYEAEIDLVVGDPLGTLGVEGVGSPENTRNFVAHLVELGLLDARAFLFLHHFRKEPTADEIDSLGGAWGPHLDSLLVLKATHRDDHARLSFPKLRWSDLPLNPLILGRVYNTQAFEVQGEEGDTKLLEPDIRDLLADGEPRTLTEIASALKIGGRRRKAIEECLVGNEHLFVLRRGEEVGRPKAKKGCWQLVRVLGQAGQADEKPLQTAMGNGVPDDHPSLEGGREEGTPKPVETQPDLFLVRDPDDEPNDLDWR